MKQKIDEKTFLKFYKDTVLGYSSNVQRDICKSLEAEGYITFDENVSSMNGKPKYFDNKRDYKAIISNTAVDANIINFYEKWEFTKLYKYSVPLFYECNKEIIDILKNNNAHQFDLKCYNADRTLPIDIGEATPIYMTPDSNSIFIKFVLQKTYFTPETFENVDYRYPVIVYLNKEQNILEIRYDSAKYSGQLEDNVYEAMVGRVIRWLQSIGITLFLCDHKNAISVIGDKENESVKIYKQMMEMGSGGSAELTAAQSRDYMLPFVGEIRELINENETLFEKAKEVKDLILQYLLDKEATANYPYIYAKWVRPVESQSYTVKITFDYLSSKYTLLQHLTGTCKDLGMERMNDAIEYLSKSGSFIKGEKI